MSSLPVETIKRDSRRLRGTLVESLADPVTGALAEADTVLLKFHGSYQQDDRDIREERRRALLEPDYRFMIRTRTPGGVVSPEQWLKMDAIATRFSTGGLRVTTRQAFQIHGVVKGDLKPTLQAINAALIDTIAACGDVNRNVLVAANPELSSLHAEVYRQAAALSERLLPNTRAYYEIWLDETRVAGSGEEDEPLYGPTYLPRKFKTAFAIPPINDVDVLAHDLGFIAISENGRLLGYNVSVGGGMGASHGDPETYPRLADVIGFVTPDQVGPIAEAVLTTQRDFGNREVRKRARLKYTIDDRGIDWFKGEVERRAGVVLATTRPYQFVTTGDRYGWVEGENGRHHLTLWIPAGRLLDRPGQPWLSGLRAIAQHHRGHFRMTPNQNLIIADVADTERATIDALVAEHGLDGYRRVAPVSRQALACVALPTCGLAMAEAERYLPDFSDRLVEAQARHGLADNPIVLRISGCPNGCSRPYLAEIALVGKGPGRYNLFLGGNRQGTRLARLYRENLDEAGILTELEPLFADYATRQTTGEGFGDFLHRTAVLDRPPASA
ncbi:MAG TPA: sulfite reductase [Xanthomonadales bacterium]|nr:sulfite reductase [Xanthomonadales bacterium]